jgi:surface carbohydrate biosynthesis protein
MRLDFSFPRRVRLVYFGRIGLGILRNYVTETDVAIYENPRERLNVWVALRMLLSRDLSEFSYYRAFLRWRKPKFVITMEDNNPLFYATKPLAPSCKTLAIQNGLRVPLAHSATSSFKEDLRRRNAAGFDADVVTTLGGLGTHFYREALAASKGRLTEVGSVINNALPIASEVPFTSPKRIVFISKFPNYGGSGGNPNWQSKVSVFVGKIGLTDSQYFHVDGLVAQLGARIAAEMNLPFAVLGKRPAWQIGEFRFFSEYLAEFDWQYLPSTSQSSSYESIHSLDVIINVDSTIGYEFLARGLRVVTVSARMQACGHPDVELLRFGHPLVREESGPFWTCYATEPEVRRIIEKAITSSVEEWEELTMPIRQLLFQYDQGNTRLCAELDSLGIQNTGPRLWTRELIPLN